MKKERNINCMNFWDLMIRLNCCDNVNINAILFTNDKINIFQHLFDFVISFEIK